MSFSLYNKTRPRAPKGTALRAEEARDFSLGYNKDSANDVVPSNQFVYATDNRHVSLGRAGTRQGADSFSVPLGEAADDSEASTTGAADQTITTAAWRAAKFVASASGRLTKVELNVKNDNSGQGYLIVDLYDDSSGEPGTKLATSAVPDNDIGASAAYEVARFIEAPEVTASTTYWIVARVQDDGSNDYKWTSTTNTTTGLTTTDSGTNWASTAYEMNFKTYVSTDGPSKGAVRAYKSNGIGTTFLAHDTTLYTVDDVSGATTSVKTGLDAEATRYRFAVVEDKVYYVNGYDAPRVYDYTTDAALGGSPSVASNIMVYKNQMFFVDADDPTKVFWSDIADYETFTSTNFLYVPSPKSPEPIKAMAILNGVMYFFTEGSKYALYGDDPGNFQLVETPGKKGTFSQETLTVHGNYIYFLSDDGVYRFGGTSDKRISDAVQPDIEAIANPQNAALGIHKNRLYVFCASPGSGWNNRAFVYHIRYERWESEDLGVYANQTLKLNTSTDNGEFMLAHPLTGQLYWYEREGNDYSDMGKPLNWEIRTRYELFESPAMKKRLKRWKPRFKAASGFHSVDCYYDINFANSPTLSKQISLQSDAVKFGDGTTFGSGAVFGGSRLKTDRMSVPGSNTYIQLRYKRTGANNPIEFLGHTLFYRIRRAR